MMLIIAYKGLNNYTYIGVGWMLHTVWDVLHHLYGNPIIPFDVSSSLGCAICDPIIALWYFLKAPTVFNVFTRKTLSKSKP